MDWLFRYTDPSIDWGYAMSTLVVRFLGVFVVLGIVQVAIQVASRVIAAVEGRAAKSSASAVVKTAAADRSATARAEAGAAEYSTRADAAAGTAERSNVSARTGAAVVTADSSATVDARVGIDDATAAAIGLALALEAGEHVATAPRVVTASGSSSAWAMAGRLRNLR